MQRQNRERQSELEMGLTTFSVPIPGAYLQKKLGEKFLVPKELKTALYVEEKVLREKCIFSEQQERPSILHCRDITSVLNVVLNRSEIGYRFQGEHGGLENDLSKQQVVFYATVYCNSHMVFYQRTTEKGLEDSRRFIGDERLQGKISVGFGGHITAEDIALSKSESLVIHKNLQGVSDVIGRSLGVSRSLYTEILEEIGVHEDQVLRSEVLGAFMDRRGTRVGDQIPVSWVHLAIPLVIELDPTLISELVFNANEIGRAWWIPVSELKNTFHAYQENKDVQIEPWTEIMIQDYLSSYFVTT